MDSSTRHQQTRAFWNSISDWYAESGETNALETLQEGGNFLNEHEKELLGDLASWCQRAVHLQCSHGNDTLSLLRQGAKEVVGVDISEKLLAVARYKSEALNVSATWYLSDLVQTPAILNGTADLVYTGKGALCWMTDMADWAQVVARLLVPGGRLFVYESHPLDWVWDVDAPDYSLDKEHGNYFSEQFRNSLFICETDETPHYRQWTMAQIVNGVIGAGLVLDRLEEFPEPFWGQFPHIPEGTLHCLPHTFALLAHKPCV